MKKKIGEKEFNAIKLMLDKGATQKSAAELFEVSIPTIGRINGAKDWEAYQAYMAEEARKARERYYKKSVKSEKVEEKPEKKEPVAMITSLNAENAKSGSTQIALTSYQVNRLLEKLDQQNEYLKLISAKLAFVVEQLA